MLARSEQGGRKMREGTVRAIGPVVKRLRAQRGWSQEELAEKAGCSKKTVENVEAGRPVFARSLSEIACALGDGVTVTDILDRAQFTDQQEWLAQPELSTESARIGNLPPLPKLVIGRSRDLSNVKRKLSKPLRAEGSHGQRPMLIVRGWPGVGKTTLARFLAHDDELARRFPDGVLWVSLGPSPQILAELQVWGRAVGMPELVTANSIQEATLRLAAALLDRRMLLLIDDVWETVHATPFAVGGRECATLITTRLSSVADQLAQRPGDAYVLPVLTEEDSLSLLETLAPDVVAEHREACRELVRELQGLPLALQVAGRLLRAERQHGWDVARLLREIRSDADRLLKSQAPPDTAAAPGETSPTVAALLRKSTDCLPKEVRKRFAALAPFAPRPATFELEAIMAVWGVDEETARKTIDVLIDRGLLEPVEEGWYEIHQVLVKHARSLLSGK